MMDILLNVLKWSAAAGAVTLIVLALRPVLDRRFSPRWRYWLWLALSAALLLSPARWESAIPSAPQPAVELTVPEVRLPLYRPGAAPASPGQDAEPGAGEGAGQGPDLQITGSQSEVPGGQVQAGQSQGGGEAGEGVGLYDVLTAVWLAGAAGAAVYCFLGTAIFSRRARRWSTPAPEELRRLYGETAAELKVRRAPELRVSRAVGSPMVVGLLRPVMYLPEPSLRREEAGFIFRHELTHVKRRDLWYKLLVLLAGCLHWFNPAAALMYRDAGETVELLCDESALRGAGRPEREAYCEMLLASAGRRRGMAGAVLSTHFRGGAGSMKNRFKNLLTGRKRFGWAALIAAVLAVTAAACAVGFGDGVRKWSLDLTYPEAWDGEPLGGGFSVGMYWDGGDWHTAGDSYSAVSDIRLTESSVSFTIGEGAAGDPGGVLSLRDLTGGEDTPETREELYRVFAVFCRYARVPGRLSADDAAGGVSFTYTFDEPLDEPLEGDQFYMAVGEASWVSNAVQGQGLAGLDGPEPVSERSVEYWNYWLNTDEWNGFVSQKYTGAEELDLGELLRLGGGIGRELTADEAAELDLAGPVYAFEREDVDGFLREMAGVSLSDFDMELTAFRTLSGRDTLYLAPGSLAPTPVLVTGGDVSGDTRHFDLELRDEPGVYYGTLTVTDGRIVSFTDPVYTAVSAEAERYSGEVSAALAGAAGELSGGDVSVKVKFGGHRLLASLQDAGGTYMAYGLELGYLPSLELPDMVEAGDPGVTLQKEGDFYYEQGAGPVVVALVSGDWEVTVLDTVSGRDAGGWSGRWEALLESLASGGEAAAGQGFAVSALGEGAEVRVLQSEGIFDDLGSFTVSAQGVSFSVYQGSPAAGWLQRLRELAVYDPERDGSFENAGENTPELWQELRKLFRVYVNGSECAGYLIFGLGNGHQDYEFRFDTPRDSLDGAEIYVSAGDPLWTADHGLVYYWTAPINFTNRCEIYYAPGAHIYYCYQAGALHGGTQELTVVWADGRWEEYLSQLPPLGVYGMDHGYYASDIAVDEGRVTFTAPLYQVTGEGYDAVLTDLGTARYSIDLATGELTRSEAGTP